MAVLLQEVAVAREERLRLVAQREQRFLRAEPAAGLRERHDLVGLHRVGARLAGIAAEGAVAAVVAAERRERHEDLRRERDGTSASAITHLARAGVELGEPRRRRLDERARVVMRDHPRRREAFFFAVFARPAVAALPRALLERASFGRTSLAKRSMFASTARSSFTVCSKTQ